MVNTLVMAPVQVGTHVVCGEWTGEVLAVYPTAINIARPDGVLVSIVSNHDSMTAFAVETSSVRDFDRLKSYLKPGMQTACSADTLSAPSLLLNLSGVQLYAGSLRSFRAHSSRPVQPAPVWRNVAALRQILSRDASPESLFSALSLNESANLFCRSAAATIHREERKRSVRLETLVGLGQGFTPAGDDFIAGALLAERFLRFLYGFSRIRRRVIWQDGIFGALHGTSAGGRTLLTGALSGSFPVYLLEVADSLLATDPRQLQITAARALKHGQTSGADACSGLLWYLETA